MRGTGQNFWLFTKMSPSGFLANISGLLRKSLTPPESSIFEVIFLSVEMRIVVFLWLEGAPSEKQMCFLGSKNMRMPL